MKVATPLGPDKLLLTGFEGAEQISGLFSFRLDMVAPNATKVEFDKLLGQKIVVALKVLEEGSSEAKYRYFGGICRRFLQGGRDDTFTTYQAEIVPQLWLLTRRAQSRIFQHMNVPDILKKVLSGIDVSWELDGNFEKRDYCVQYRETDFNFASRLMEEEGIFYFFRHTEDGHKMIVGNSARVHPDVPEPVKCRWRNMENSAPRANHIHEWQKAQEIRSGKFTLWDHCFERPGDNFESKKNTLGSVAVGKVTHKLEVAGNSQMEIYDYPGEFSQRFDGIDKGGGVQAGELGKISPDGTRTVELRMQAETVAALAIHGSSNCSQFTTGHKFTLEEHFDAEGAYVLATVHHAAHGGNAYLSGDQDDYLYTNSFTCIPKALPYRPQRATPKPSVVGVQTATVVGPKGEEIFTDKYGRVKVQFHWDREGKMDADSSCWLRVGTPWAGKGWGAISIPRIGQEVIVDFLEGDADQPIIIGSVYNAGVMPAFPLPDKKMISGIKTQTHKGGGYNEMTMDDTAGAEKIVIHGQYDMNTTVENNQTDVVHNNRTTTVDVDDTESIGANQTISVSSNQKISVGADQEISVGAKQKESVGADQTVTVGANQSVTVAANADLKVSGNHSVSVSGNQETDVGGNRSASITANDEVKATGKILLDSATEVSINAGVKIILSAGGSSIEIGPAGVTIQSAAKVTVMGAMINLN